MFQDPALIRLLPEAIAKISAAKKIERDAIRFIVEVLIQTVRRTQPKFS